MGLSNQYEGNKFLDNQPFLNQEIADELAHYCPGDSPQSTTLACVCVQSKWFPGTACQASFTYLLLRSAGYSPLLSLWSFLGRMAFFFVFSLISLAIGSDYSSMANKKRPIHFALAAWLLGSEMVSFFFIFPPVKKLMGKGNLIASIKTS